jgi:hypothetical protein
VAAIASLIALWILVLLPAVLFSQWFTLDMGGVFAGAADFPDNLARVINPYKLGGRYFPAYWLYHFLVFGIYSTNIAAHFAVQAFLFLIALGLTGLLMFRLSRSLAATVVFGIAVCLSGAIAENLYTFGKAEPLAYLFLMAILWIFHGLQRTRSDRPEWRYLAISVLFAFAVWTKETSVVLFAFPPAAIVIGIFVFNARQEAGVRRELVVRYGKLLLALFAGVFITRIPYLLFTAAGESKGYVDYTVDLDLVTDNLAFYLSQHIDIVVSGIGGAVLCLMAILRARRNGNQERQPAKGDVVFVAALVVMAWGYFAAFMVWRWPMGYYMLLAAIVFKFCAIWGYFAVLAGPGRVRRGKIAAWAVAAFCAIFGALHAYYVATSQIDYSKTYTEALFKYLEVSRPGERLIIESYPFYAEQITNTGQVLSLVSGGERAVRGIASILDPSVATPALLKLLSVTQEQLDRDEESLPRKDDYLLVMTGNKLAMWSIRGVAPHFSDDSILAKDDAYEMVPVAQGKQFSWGAYVNVWTYRLNVGQTYIGYKLYKVTTERPKLFWRNRFPDGWVGKQATLRLYPEFGKTALLTVSTPDFNSPNRIVITRNDLRMAEMVLEAGQEKSIELEVDSIGGPTRIVLDVERTTVPKDRKINKDKRALGVLVRLEARN